MSDELKDRLQILEAKMKTQGGSRSRPARAVYVLDSDGKTTYSLTVRNGSLQITKVG